MSYEHPANAEEQQVRDAIVASRDALTPEKVTHGEALDALRYPSAHAAAGRVKTPVEALEWVSAKWREIEGR